MLNGQVALDVISGLLKRRSSVKILGTMLAASIAMTGWIGVAAADPWKDEAAMGVGQAAMNGAETIGGRAAIIVSVAMSEAPTRKNTDAADAKSNESGRTTSTRKRSSASAAQGVQSTMIVTDP
jgi:hypothetical protein